MVAPPESAVEGADARTACATWLSRSGPSWIVEGPALASAPVFSDAAVRVTRLGLGLVILFSPTCSVTIASAPGTNCSTSSCRARLDRRVVRGSERVSWSA